MNSARSSQLLVLLLMLTLLHGADAFADEKGDARTALAQKHIPFDDRAFFEAIRSGQSATVELFLQAGFNVRAKDPDPPGDGWQSIHVASYLGNLEIVRSLLEHGAQIDEPAPGRRAGETPLLLAISRGHLRLAKFLIDRGAAVAGTPPVSGYTPLQTAAVTGPLKLVKLLVAKGAPVNLMSAIGETPLQLALRAQHPEIAEFLIKNGADLADGQADSALLLAARYGYMAIVEALLDRGASINSSDLADGWTALHWASRNGYEGIVRVLIINGAHVNARSKRRTTPLFGAASAGNDNVIAVLVDNGADVNARDSDNRTALYGALSSAEERAAMLLLKHGADVNVATKDGETPLMAAARNGLNDAVRLLLAKRADLRARNHSGQTAYDVAISHARQSTAALLTRPNEP